MTYPEITGTAHLDETLIEFSGADVRAWLQGQITNDINLIDAQPGMEACICSPTGHIEATVKLWSVGNQVLVSTPTECVDSFLNRVNRFVIMEDVDASVRELRCLHTFADRPPVPADALQITLPARRFGVDGWDHWMSNHDAGLVNSANLLGQNEFAALRIESGSPKMGQDISAKTLAPELGEAFVRRTISENKGCYVGQEVIHRIHSRGHTNRTWRFLRCDSLVPIGAELLNDDGEVCGRVTSSAISPREGPIAAGMIKNKWTAAGTTLTANGVKAIVEDFPRA